MYNEKIQALVDNKTVPVEKIKADIGEGEFVYGTQLYRSGQYDKAIQVLEKCTTNKLESKWGILYCQLLTKSSEVRSTLLGLNEMDMTDGLRVSLVRHSLLLLRQKDNYEFVYDLFIKNIKAVHLYGSDLLKYLVMICLVLEKYDEAKKHLVGSDPVVLGVRAVYVEFNLDKAKKISIKKKDPFVSVDVIVDAYQKCVDRMYQRLTTRSVRTDPLEALSELVV
jgi:tetratricopeptide (TPR) repeat protein